MLKSNVCKNFRQKIFDASTACARIEGMVFGEIIFYKKYFFLQKKYFVRKNISLKVIPSILAQVGEAAKLISPKVHWYL